MCENRKNKIMKHSSKNKHVQYLFVKDEKENVYFPSNVLEQESNPNELERVENEFVIKGRQLK